MKPVEASPISLRRWSVLVGAAIKMVAKSFALAAADVFGGFFDWEVEDEDAVNSREPRDFTEFFHPHAEDGIQVSEDDQACGLRVLADFRSELQYLFQRCVVL